MTLSLFSTLPNGFHRDMGMSEDCLSVNVFAPSKRYDQPLPVLAWVYGGSFNTGSSAVAIYDPSELVRRAERDGKPVIVVTGNHRLNAFGFAAHPDLAHTGPFGNYGLRDIMAMFQCVQLAL